MFYIPHIHINTHTQTIFLFYCFRKSVATEHSYKLSNELIALIIKYHEGSSKRFSIMKFLVFLPNKLIAIKTERPFLSITFWILSVLI